MRTSLWLLGVLALQLVGFAAPGRAGVEDPKPAVALEAVRSVGEINVDGTLSESVWHRTGFDAFTERDPNEGTKPSERTEVWVAYDQEALYVAARMFDSSPDSIIWNMRAATVM